MTKRWIALFCALILLLSLAACGDSDGDTKANTEATASAADDPAMEKAFAAAFEADKSYDIDAMAQVEYAANFSKSVDKEAAVSSAKKMLEEIDEKSLEEYRESLSDMTYTILEETELTGTELKERIEKLSEDFRDTDKITAIVKLTYDVSQGDSDTAVNENAVEMIKVDGVWYCYLGKTTWEN